MFEIVRFCPAAAGSSGREEGKEEAATPAGGGGGVQHPALGGESRPPHQEREDSLSTPHEQSLSTYSYRIDPD